MKAESQGSGLNQGRQAWRMVVDLVLLAFCVAMLALMVLEAGQETIPYHLLFPALTLIYGYRVWPLWPSAVIILLVTLSTGLILYRHYQAGYIDGPELAEIPLMPALLTAMVWHARRRAAAQAALQEMADQQSTRLERERMLFRNTSHAIRTPVTIARGHLELTEQLITTSEVRDDVRVALDQLERLAVLSQRLLALAQLDSGEVPVREHVFLRPVLEELGRNWSLAAERDWHFVCWDDVVVQADSAWLSLALDALIENAVHHTYTGGRITVLAGQSGRHASIRIFDDGPGIAREDAGRVFERFWHRLPPNGPMGSGLGLSSARATVRSWGGDVVLRPGELGAEFEVLLPCVPRAGGVRKPNETPTETPTEAPSEETRVEISGSDLVG